MRRPPLGQDPFGIVHYDSMAKVTYIWPLCRTPHLSIVRAPNNIVVTCIRCLVAYVNYNWHEVWR